MENKILNYKRKDYLSWDAFFMGIAKLASGRSKDPHTQVGACIVSDDNRILSIGYNGAPNNYNDDIFPWKREGPDTETKYMYVCHAEANAINNYLGSRRDLKGSRIYVDLFPCNECAKDIVQAGIKEVIYLSDKYNGTDGNIVSKKIFDTCGVKYRRLDKAEEKIIKLFIKPDVSLEYLEK